MHSTVIAKSRRQWASGDCHYGRDNVWAISAKLRPVFVPNISDQVSFTNDRSPRFVKTV